MATFRSGVKILGHISKTKGHGGAPFRSRSCDRRTLLNIQTRQESAFVVQDSCEDSLKATRRSRSWLSIFSRNRSPDSASEDDRVVRKEDESWFTYFSKKPLQVNEKKITSEAADKDHEEHILRDKKGEKDVNRTVYSDIIRENVSSSISKGAVCHLHKSPNIMSPRSTVVPPLSREIALAYGKSGFHSIPSNSYTKDKITTLKKHVASVQQSKDINYSSMVTQIPEASTSLPYTASEVQNLIMMSLSKSSSGCANPHLFMNNEAKRNSYKGTSQEKTSIIDFGSQNLQLHSSTSKLKSKTNDIGAMKQKGNIKQQTGLPKQKLQSQSSLPNAYADKADHKVLYSESSSVLPVNNERQKREREAFLKTKALISMKPVASIQNSKTPSVKKVLQSNSYSVNDHDLLKCTPLKLNIKPKGKVLDQYTNPYVPEIKPKTQKSKYISDSPLIKQKSHPTQFVVHPSMIANSSIPLRLSSNTANPSEKYRGTFEESKIYQNDIKGPITTLSSLIDKVDATAEHSHMVQNLRNKQAVVNILKHENLSQQEHYIGRNQATKIDNDYVTNLSCEPPSNAETQSCSTQETATKPTVTADCSQEPNNIDSTNTNTAEEIMLEKKHKYHDDLNENMRSKFGMHMPYFKNQNNILAFKKSKSNKTNKNESVSMNKQKDAAKPLLWTPSPKLAKQKEDNVSEVCEADVDKMHNSEISKASPRTSPEEEYSQQKTEVLSDMSKSLDSKAVTTDDTSIKTDKTACNECVSSTNEVEKSETVSEEQPELTLQTDYGPNEDNVEMHQQVSLEKPTPSLRRHKYFPNYFSKRSLSGYTDPPAFGEKLEISFCPGKEKGSSGKCKTDEKSRKTKSCAKVTIPCCERAKNTTSCAPPPNDECHKRMSPAPSYSECIKPPLPPKDYGECSPIKDLECPQEKRKEYDSCKYQPPVNVCAESEKRKKQGDGEIHTTDNTCPNEKECPEPYKGQKPMGCSGSSMKFLSRKFSNYLFQNDLSNRLYSTSENENPLLSNRNLSTIYPNPVITQSSFYHKKIECKSGCKDPQQPADKSCKRLTKKEEKKKKAKCAKISQEGCALPKSTLCVPPTNFEKCSKVLAPKPSYSECMKSVEIPPRPFTECDTTVDLECPVKKRKNYDACRPTRKPDSPCPATKSEKKNPQWKDNTCPKDEECPTPWKKANTGYSNAAIKCPSMNKTAAYLPPRRYFSCASSRYIFKCHSSPALDSSSSYNEEITYTPFIVAQHMRNDSQLQSSHERNTQKGKPFVTLSASYCSSPIFLDYMAFKRSCKCKNCIALNTNFLQKIAPDSNKVNKVAQCTYSKRPKCEKETTKRTGIKSMEMERLSEKDIILKKCRLSGSYVPKNNYLTYNCLLHSTQQDMVSERTYCTWSTIKQSTKSASQKNIGSIRQCSCKKKSSSDSLNEPCEYEPVKEVEKEVKESAEKPFTDCPTQKKEKSHRCQPKKMKVVAPPIQVKEVQIIIECPKPPKKEKRKCEEPPIPRPPPPKKPIEHYTECPKPKPKAKLECVEEVKEDVQVAGVCRNVEPAPFTQCPKPKCKPKRKCEEFEPPSEPCKDGKKHRSECPNSSKKKCSGISSQFIISHISPHSIGMPVNLSWPKVRFYYKLARSYSIKNLRNVCSKANVNVMLHFLSNMKPLFSFLKVMERYPELHSKQQFRSAKYAVANSEKKKQTSPFYNQYKYINESKNAHRIISRKRMSSKKQRPPPSFSEYMHLKSKSKRKSGKNRSASKMKTKQQSLNSRNASVSKERKHIPCLKLPALPSAKSIKLITSPITNSPPNAPNASTLKSSPILLPPPKSCASSLPPLPSTSSAVTEAQSAHNASKSEEKAFLSSSLSSLPSSSSPTSCSSSPSSPESSPTQTPQLPQSASPQLSPSLCITDKISLTPLSSRTSSPRPPPPPPPPPPPSPSPSPPQCLPKPVSSSTQRLPASQNHPPIASCPSQTAPPANSCPSPLQSTSVKSASSRARSSSKCSSVVKPLSPSSAPPCPAVMHSPESPKTPSSLAKKCACLLPEIICKILNKENTLEMCRGKKKCSREDF